MNNLQYAYSVHAISSQLINVSSRSRLKSTFRYQVESDVLKSTAVDLGPL